MAGSEGEAHGLFDHTAGGCPWMVIGWEGTGSESSRLMGKRNGHPIQKTMTRVQRLTLFQRLFVEYNQFL